MMTTWTPPASTSWSVNDVDYVHAALKDRGTCDAALAYLDDITDAGLLYVLATRVAVRDDIPWSTSSAAGLRTFIRNRV